MEVEIAAEAERDLADIVSYIAQDSSAAAARMADELRAACEGHPALRSVSRSFQGTRALAFVGASLATI